MQSDDIVTRLRAVLHNDRSVELMNREAADEIEQLRSDKEKCHDIMESQSRQIASLSRKLRIAKDERYEARRMVCSAYALMGRDIATERGWDCCKEER